MAGVLSRHVDDPVLVPKKVPGILSRIAAMPNPGYLVSQGVDRITTPGYPVDDALRGYMGRAPAFQPTLGQAASAWRDEGLGQTSEFLTALQRGDLDAVMNSSLFPMGAMTAYHGSPHKFDAFDLSKIGTGEGAQAYGHGLYFAESPGVAKSYQKALGHKDVVKQFRSELPDDIGVDEIVEALYRGELPPKVAGVVKALKDDDWLGFDYPSQAISAAFKNIDEFDPSPALRSAIKEYGGNLYHVDIPDEAIDKMLDWDKPLSQQPEAVRAAFANAADDLRYGPLKKNAPILDPNDKYTTAGDAYKALALHLNGGSRVSRMGGSVDGADKAASEYLKSIGIPGIKYLDSGSRFTSGAELIGVWRGDQKVMADKASGEWFARVGKKSSDVNGPVTGMVTSPPMKSAEAAKEWADSKIAGGSRNFVLFDDKTPKIIKRE